MVNASPEQVETIEDGADAPNPVDPRTLAVGGGIVLTEESYTGWGMTAQYKGLVLSSGHREGDRVAAGVTRTSASAVRIYAGEQEFVEEATRSGLGIPGLSVGIGTTSEAADGRLRQVDLDIATPAGWHAYQDFVATGALPEDGDGVADSADVDQEIWSSRTEIAAQVGPVSASMLMDDSAGVYSRARHADGSTIDSLSSRVEDVTLLSESRTDAGGARATTYGLLLHGVENSELALYDRYHGGFEGELPDGSTNARIDFTAADLDAIQQQVYETIAFANRDESGGIFDGATTAEVAAYYERLGDAEHEGGFDRGDIPYGMWFDEIARADNPEEVLGPIARASRGDPHEALAFLNRISDSVALARDVDPGAGTGTAGELRRLDGSDCR